MELFGVEGAHVLAWALERVLAHVWVAWMRAGGAAYIQPANTMSSAFVRGLKAIPLEVYPIMGMMSCALAFGGYIATKNLMYDRDLRIREDRGNHPEHWRERLNGRL
ncbi:hypothetical protein HK405_012778 [Cladochytrium tenue]|nr:hypothetical protein HK405_012778 [Cladochytrium tenue]